MNTRTFLTIFYLSTYSLLFGQGFPVSEVNYSNPQDALTRQLDKTKPVYSLPGSVNVVNGMGGYNIPIEMPVGINGLQPNISISYSSNTSNGIMGLGWNLGGLSYISRTGKTHAVDGWMSGFSLDDQEDNLALDGQRLIHYAGTPLGTNGSYRTLYQSYREILYTGNGFTVTEKNGLKKYYGTTPATRLNYQRSVNGNPVDFEAIWLLEKVEDRNGNYMEYEYVTDATHHEWRLNKITYTKHESIPTNNSLCEVQFYYSTRNDVRDGYKIGNVMKQSHLLESIRTTFNGQEYTRYDFKYEWRGGVTGSEFSRLIEIDYSVKGQAVNPTIINWGATPNEYLYQGSSQWDPDFSANLGANGMTADVDLDGDGLTDVLTLQGRIIDDGKCWDDFKNWDIKIYQFKLSAHFKNQSGNGFTSVVIRDWFSSNYKPGDCRRSPFCRIYPGDFNGDGLNEFILQWSEITTSTVNGFYLDFYLNDPQNPGTFVKNNTERITDHLPHGYKEGGPHPILYKPGNNPFNLLVNDFDGDGITDYSYSGSDRPTIIPIAGSNAPPVRWVVKFRNKDQSVQKHLVNVTTYGVSSVDSSHFGDFDGDGRADMLIVGDSKSIGVTLTSRTSSERLFTSSVPNSDNHLHIGDFNGDGISDILSYDLNTDDFTIINATGTGLNLPGNTLSFVTEQLDLRANANGKPRQEDGPPFLFVQDADSDGRDDLIFFDEDNGQFDFTVYYNKIDGWLSRTHPLVATDVDWLPWNARKAFHWGDFKGTGNTQVLYERDIVNVSDHAFFLSFKQDDRSRHVTHVLNGYNQLTAFEYQRLTEAGGVYTRNDIYEYPNPSIIHSGLIVSALKQKDFDGNLYSDIRYNYVNLRANYKGLGIQGYNKIIEKDMIRQVMIEKNTSFIADPANTTHDCWPFLPFSSATKLLDGTNISTTEKFYVHSTLIQTMGSQYVFNPRLDLERSKDYLLNSSSASKYTYDTRGNVTQLRKRVFDNINHHLPALEEENIHSSGFVQNGGWIPWLPETITTTNQRDGQSLVSVTENRTYYTNGNLESKTLHPGTEAEVKTEFTYTTGGNIEDEKTTYMDMPPRLNKTVWEANERLVDYTLNEKNWKIDHVDTDPFTAQVKETADFNNLTTTYQYDSFGRLIHTVLPDGNTKSKNYIWNTSASFTEPLFRVEESGTNTPPATAWYDGQSREIRSERKNQQDVWVYTSTEYNAKSETSRSSLPYLSGGTPDWIVYTYDDYGRLTSRVSPSKNISTAYEGRRTIITNETSGQSTSKTVDGSGKTVTATDDGGNINYIYNSWGEVEEIRGPASTISLEYDDFGRKTAINDPAAGRTSYSYYPSGQLKQQTDANNNTYNFTYDILDRITEKSGNEGAYTYSYDRQFLGLIDQEVSPYGPETEYSYDAYGRVEAQIERIEGEEYEFQYEYDTYGNTEFMVYPNSMTIQYSYTPNGFMNEMKIKVDGGDDKPLWKYIDQNRFGQITEYELGDVVWSKSYDPLNGFPVLVEGNGVWEYGYEFEQSTGNLLNRSDNMKGLFEDFDYDHLDRLTEYGTTNITISYDAHGNILSKGDVGSYENDAVSGQTLVIHDNPHTISEDQQNLTYTPFNSIASIQEGDYDAFFTYGHDQQRKVMRIENNGQVEIERVYVTGNLYERDFRNGQWKNYSYIHTPVGQALVVVNETNLEANLYFLITDYQGSILALMDETGGEIVEEYSYDPWGNRRNVNTWEIEYHPGLDGLAYNGLMYRGYTGHEHLEMFGLINMNGRLYDPLLGRMLSPDNFVSAPDNTQNLNRYTYVVNNPLKYTDPSGEEPISFAAMAIIAGSITGAAGGMASYLGQAMQANEWDWAKFGGSILGGAVTGAVFGYIAPTAAFTGWAASLPMNTLGSFAGSFIPSANFSSGDWRFSISPALAFGNAKGVGFNIGATYTDGAFVLSGGYGLTSYAKAPGTGKPTIENRFSGMVGYQTAHGGIALGTTHFYHGKDHELNQTVGRLSLNALGAWAYYENDGYPFSKWLADGHDRMRTAAAGIGFRQYGIGFNLFTGDYGADKRTEDIAEHPKYDEQEKFINGGYYSNPEADKYRMGAVFMSIGAWRMGEDAEKYRHAIQNKFAHTVARYQPWFKVKNIPAVKYSQYTYNPYTSW